MKKQNSSIKNYMTKQLLLISALICVYSLSAMKKEDICTHNDILAMHKNGKLELNQNIPYYGQQYTLIRADTINNEGRFVYELIRPAIFGPFNVGTDHLTVEDNLENPNQNCNSTPTRIYNNTTRYFGWGLSYASFGLGCLGLIYGIAKIFKVGK